MNTSLANLILTYGNTITKSQNASKTVTMRRFKSFFGVSPSICSHLWGLIQNKLTSDFTPKHLLWALLFLKCYNTEHVNHATVGCDEKTFREKVRVVVEKLSLIKVIEWEDRKALANHLQSCFVSIDGVDCPIQEPTPFSPRWYSHKFKKAGLRYEIALCIKTGIIVWVNGGYPCGHWPDLKIARHLFVQFLDQNEKVLADKGYRDDRYFILPNPTNSAEHKRIMSRHETINKRIKHFNVLNQKFRHPLPFHKKCFFAVANITNLVIKFEQPLFSLN